MKVSKPKRRITRRLIFYIVLFSSVITLLITAIQLAQEYSDGVDGVKGRVMQIKTLSLPALTENLWNLYEKQLQTQLDDLIQVSDLQYLEIRSRGKLVASAGAASSANTISEVLPLIYSRGDESTSIGSLLVVATLDGVYQQLYDRVLVILVSNAFKTALVSIFIYLVFGSLIIRHLSSISDHVKRLSSKSLDRKLSLNRRPAKDELQDVVAAINEMGVNLNRTTVSKKYLDNIIASMADSLFVVNPDNTIRLVNKATVDFLGYEERELIGKPLESIFNDKQGNDLERAIDPSITEGVETICLAKNGDKIPALMSASVMRGGDDQVQGTVYVVHDITERKRWEAALAQRTQELYQSRETLRNLALSLQELRERERTVVAREIHDELGQALTALRMDLAWLMGKLPKNRGELHDRGRAMAELVGSTVDNVRRIASSLRPAILDDLGLPAAIEWIASDFGERTGIQCRIDVKDLDPAWGMEANTAAFRIVQEALTNVARHANATKVEVSLTPQGNNNEFVLDVTDDGVGISDAALSNQRSLGLLGMHERAAALGWRLDIAKHIRGGTKVALRISHPPHQVPADKEVLQERNASV